MTTDWHGIAPNHGYLLEDAGEVVGAYVAYYTRRHLGGVERDVCNLGAWCVLDTHRFHSVRLLKALLADARFDYIDLSPSGNVVGLNKRLGFDSLDTSTVIVPNLPWPSWPRRTWISSDPRVIEATLTPEELAIYHDHRDAAAAHHLVVRRGDDHCYVIFRRDRRKNLPIFASILYVSNPGRVPGDDPPDRPDNCCSATAFWPRWSSYGSSANEPSSLGPASNSSTAKDVQEPHAQGRQHRLPVQRIGPVAVVSARAPGV